MSAGRWRKSGTSAERVITDTVGMYGEIRGIVGASMPEIPALTLEGITGFLKSG